MKHSKAVSFLKLASVRSWRRDVRGSALSLLRAYSRLGDERRTARLLFDARMRQTVRQIERLERLGAVLRRLQELAP